MKKIISLCLLAIMFVSVLASCNKTNNTDDTVSTDAVSEDNITTAPATEEPVEQTGMKEYDLAKLTIVYADSYDMKFATELRTRFKEELGIDVAMKKGTESKEYELELITGNAPREISKACFDIDSDIYLKASGLVYNNGKIQLLGTDRMTFEASVEYFFDNVINKDTKTICIPEQGQDIVEITNESISIPKKNDDSQIRFVTNNILCQNLNPSWDRMMGLISAYRYIDADICAFQEVSSPWHSTYKLTERMQSIGFSLVTDNKKVNTPIFYKTERFELIEGGYDSFDTSNLTDTTEKQYAWACLKEKATGKKLIVISTHLLNNGPGATDEQKKIKDKHREECARQLLDIIKDFQNKYGNAPVLVAGDFNSLHTSEVYKIMTSQMNSARDNCENKVNMDIDTYTGKLAEIPPKTGRFIDHVFYSKSGITAKHFETVVSPYTYIYSDHVPALLDFELN